MPIKTITIYMAVVLIAGLVHASGMFDKDVTFLVCLAITVPCSILTSPLLYFVVAPALAFIGIPPAVGQVVSDLGYALIGGALNVLLVKTVVAAVRTFRATRSV
ncbi:hypothetical protein ACFVT1_33770 [Streptomyces sp. NPDC057963]|uniref:hypothetical protein n=1 Tax=Streptomyces sp. NPDC057963 TaxID=3346290 RepID=UPI0036E3ACD4